MTDLTVGNSWIGYGSLHAPKTSQFQWRFPLAFQVVPALVLIIGMIFLPESPRYLIEKEHYAEGMKVLRKLHFDGTNEEWIETEFSEIRRTIEAEKGIAAQGWVPMFTVPQWRIRMLYVSPFSPTINVPISSMSLEIDLLSVQTRPCCPAFHPNDRHKRNWILSNNHVQSSRLHWKQKHPCRRSIQLCGPNR